MLTYPNIFVNDYAMQFFRDHGYPDSSYNDGMLAWLRDFYGVTGSTLPDLLARYRGEYGDDFVMRVLAKSAVPISLVEPAATFINATPSSAAGGNDTLLTSAGVHGLTSAVSVGLSIYISAGTGWTVGFHTITAIAVDTTGTTIQIDTPFDAGMGTPTIALASTEVTAYIVQTPPLLPNSLIRIGFSMSGTISGDSKRFPVRFDGTAIFNAQYTIAPYGNIEINVQNRGATNSQIVGMPITATSNVGFGAFNTPHTTFSLDTSIPQQITFNLLPSAANTVVTIERYFVELFL